VVPGSGRVLTRLDENEVGERLTRFAKGRPGATLGPGGSGTVLLDTALPPGARVPSRLVHDFTVSFDPDPGLRTTERSGRTSVTRARAVVVGAPLRGARWIDINGCCGPGSHREAVNPINGAFHVAERFAIDFAQLSAHGRAFVGDPARLSSWPSYGDKVISATPGVMVGLKDGIADNDPAASPRTTWTPSAATTSWWPSAGTGTPTTHTCNRGACTSRSGTGSTAATCSAFQVTTAATHTLTRAHLIAPPRGCSGARPAVAHAEALTPRPARASRLLHLSISRWGESESPSSRRNGS
jgi:hypothetical protein